MNATNRRGLRAASREVWVEARDGVRGWNPGEQADGEPTQAETHSPRRILGWQRPAGSYFYRKGLGFSQVAYSGQETGQRQRASYALSQGKANFILTTPTTPDDLAARGGSARFRALTNLHSPAVSRLEASSSRMTSLEKTPCRRAA